MSTHNPRPGIRLLAIAPLSLCLLTCNGDTTQVACQSDLGVTDDARKVQAFVDTATALTAAAADIDSEMLNVCRAMASDLGIPSGDLAPAGNATAPGAATDAACRRVRGEIDRIVHADLVANGRLALVSSPSVCTVDPGARLRCEQQCDPATGATTQLACAVGHAYGACMTACIGRCTGTCSDGCAGPCAGLCTGTCVGTCDGACVGTCAVRNPDGSCYGACAGTCTGVCDGSCAGSCSDTCSGGCAASCTGTCEGDCAVWIQPPACTQVQPATQVEECKTNCDARAHFQAACTAPALAVSYGYAASAAQKAALDRLLLALRSSGPAFLRTSARAALVAADSGAGYAAALQGIAATAAQGGPGAAACAADASTRAASAAAKVQISVSAAAAISASVTAMGGVLPP